MRRIGKPNGCGHIQNRLRAPNRLRIDPASREVLKGWLNEFCRQKIGSIPPFFVVRKNSGSVNLWNSLGFLVKRCIHRSETRTEFGQFKSGSCLSLQQHCRIERWDVPHPSNAPAILPPYRPYTGLRRPPEPSQRLSGNLNRPPIVKAA